MSVTAPARCRRCGSDFAPRRLTRFEGIEVWERRYCASCASARIADENAWDTNRQRVGDTEPTSEVPVIREYAILREDLERHIAFDPALAMLLERAYLGAALRVTQAVDTILDELRAGNVERPAGLLHHRLKQITSSTP